MSGPSPIQEGSPALGSSAAPDHAQLRVDYSVMRDFFPLGHGQSLVLHEKVLRVLPRAFHDAIDRLVGRALLQELNSLPPEVRGWVALWTDPGRHPEFADIPSILEPMVTSALATLTAASNAAIPNASEH